jgi:hypothetical protein
VDGHCERTVHAEANALMQAAKHGVRVNGATIYTTASPCYGCFKLIANAGVKRIVFGEMYRDQRIYSNAKAAGIELVDLSRSERVVAKQVVLVKQRNDENLGLLVGRAECGKCQTNYPFDMISSPQTNCYYGPRNEILYLKCPTCGAEDGHANVPEKV